ncbi:MAG TPA: serine/threonine-protein kinase [Rhizomicrobium sp.]|nr:serine/threonine-protein kinase [Rhizomicrobium sp.]
MSAPYHNKALPQGTLLREWRLEEVLGTGGFGIVYRGRGVYFGEDVAIKEYFPAAISDRREGNTVAPNDYDSEEIYELGRKKFLEEAKVLWNLSRPQRHPNIVSVRALFEIHGTAYMVMDFESGTSLSEMLHAGRTFDEKSLLDIIRPVAEGLDCAHRAGVLHRDIKPANILVNATGRPVLIDFGSARFDAGQATNTKVTFYTPPYAAIEQYVKTFPQGPWTDIYALGVAMYQCVSGEKPPEVLERLHGGLGQALSAKEWPGYSRNFTRAVDAAMEIRPQDRPQSISDWLKLFDANSVSDEATRIGMTVWADMPTLPVSMPTATPTPPPVAPATPALAPAPPQSMPSKPGETTAASGAKKKSGGSTPAIIGAFAALVLVCVAGVLLWPRHKSADPLPASAFASSAPAAANKQAALGPALDGLIAAAQGANRPQAEIALLTDAKTKILALETQKTPEAKDQLNQAARDMAKAEITALGRSARRTLRDLGAAPDPNAAADTAKSIDALKTAKSDLDAKLAVELTALDAPAAVGAAQQALDSYVAFQAAYATAAPQYVAARKQDLTTLLATAQSTTDQIVALAGGSKPWFLASQARKQAYQLRQDNAVQAKALFTQLSSAASVAQSSKDLKLVISAITQVTTGQATLSSLYAASNAAKL